MEIPRSAKICFIVAGALLLFGQCCRLLEHQAHGEEPPRYAEYSDSMPWYDSYGRMRYGPRGLTDSERSAELRQQDGTRVFTRPVTVYVDRERPPEMREAIPVVPTGGPVPTPGKGWFIDRAYSR